MFYQKVNTSIYSSVQKTTKYRNANLSVWRFVPERDTSHSVQNISPWWEQRNILNGFSTSPSDWFTRLPLTWNGLLQIDPNMWKTISFIIYTFTFCNLHTKTLYSCSQFYLMVKIGKTLIPSSAELYFFNSMVWVRERTAPTELPPLAGEVIANFPDRGCNVVSVTDPYGRILGFLDRSRYFAELYFSCKAKYCFIMLENKMLSTELG
jgi:hypothetical protein